MRTFSASGVQRPDIEPIKRKSDDVPSKRRQDPCPIPSSFLSSDTRTMLWSPTSTPGPWRSTTKSIMRGYTANLNAALEGHPEFHSVDAEHILRGFNGLPGEVQNAVRNNGGGYHNHSLFWDILTPGGSRAPAG